MSFGSDVAHDTIRGLYPDVEKSNFYHTTGTRGMKTIHYVGVRLKKEVHHYPYDPKTGAITGKKQVFDWSNSIK